MPKRTCPMKKATDRVIKSAMKAKAKSSANSTRPTSSTPPNINKWKKVFEGSMDSAKGRRAGTFLANLAHNGSRPLKKHQVGCKLYASLPPAVKSSRRLVRELIEHAILKRPQYLRHLPDKLRSDRALTSMAVMNDGLALQYVKGAPKKDREIVLKAVEQNGSALRLAPKQFRCDLEVVEAALTAKRCTGDGHSPLQYVEGTLRNAMMTDEKYVKLAVQQEGAALFLVERKFRMSKEIVLLAYERGRFRKAARLALGSLQQDEDILNILRKEHYSSAHFYN